MKESTYKESVKTSQKSYTIDTVYYNTQRIILTYRKRLNQVDRYVDDSQEYDPYKSPSLSRNDLQIDIEFQTEHTYSENPRKEYPTTINIPFLSSCLAFFSDQEPVLTVIDQLFTLLLQHRDNIAEVYQPIRDIVTIHKSLLDDIIDCSGILDRIDKTHFNAITLPTTTKSTIFSVIF